MEADTLGVVAQYRSDHRLASDKALAWYSDGGFEQAMQDYDPATNRGQLYLLHQFPPTVLPEGQDWSVTFSVQDGPFMDFRTFTAHTFGSGAAMAAGGDVLTGTADGVGAYAAAAEATGTAPAVSGVFVRGSAWTSAFKTYLATTGVGDATYGYSLPASDQLNELPWTNLDQVSIRFSEDVVVEQAHLIVNGVNTPTSTITAFTYDEATFTATWTLSAPVVNDKALLHLSNLVEDLDGERLDGEWANAGAGPDTFPSGDGTAGGAFDFRLNVLPGDVTRSGSVNSLDVSDVKRRENTSTTNPGTLYSVFHDVNGSGTITSADATGDTPNDLALVQARLNTILPSTDPSMPTFAAAPSGLLLTVVSENQIDLSWTDNSADETGFLIDASLDGSAFYEAATVPAVVGTGTRTYSFTQGFPNLTHYFRVAALSGAGASAYAGPASASTKPPVPDVLIIEQVTQSQIDLSWAALTDLSYTLEWQQDGGAWTAVPMQTPGTFSHTGLAEGKRYNYRMRASGSGGVSDYSDTSGATTLPASPTSLAATAVDGSVPAIDLRWTDNSGAESGFRVEASANGGSWHEIATAGPSAGTSGTVTLSLTDLAADTPYEFKIYAYNDGGDSLASNTATATTGWLTNGEASVAVSGSSRIVTLGVAGRAETASQGQGVHGASLLLAPAASYTISFTPDLQTWDSYTPESVAGTGYWDSFSVSLGALPYWQRTDLTQDPLNLPFIWGGANFDPNQAGTGKETYTTARTVTVTSPDAAQPQYLSVVLDTNTQNQADSAYPSWGTITISAPAPLPVLPTVSVRTTPDRSQSAEGATTDAAKGQFTVYREGGSLAQDLDVDFDIGGTADRATDYTASFSSTGSSFNQSTGHGTVKIPANAQSATITIEAANDGTGGADANLETVVLTIAEKPRYKRAAANSATINIIDRKKYFVYFYGTGGPDRYGDGWLDKLRDIQVQNRGYATLGETINGTPYGGTRENRVAGAVTRFLDAINKDGGNVISAAEAESSDVTMAGHSLGGSAAVNFSYYVNRVDKGIEGYRLKGAVPIKSLVTWDPNVDLRIGPLVVRAQHPIRSIEANVKKSRNYYQRRAGFTNWERLDAQGNVIGNARLPRLLGEMTVLGNTVQTAPGDDRGAPIRLDTALANQPEVLDRYYAANPDWDPLDGDPIYTGGAAERQYRLYGNKDARRGVNHSTMTWYAWRASKDDLA